MSSREYNKSGTKYECRKPHFLGVGNKYIWVLFGGKTRKKNSKNKHTNLNGCTSNQFRIFIDKNCAIAWRILRSAHNTVVQRTDRHKVVHRRLYHRSLLCAGCSGFFLVNCVCVGGCGIFFMDLCM